MTWFFLAIVVVAIPLLSIRAQLRLGSGPLPLPRRALYQQTMIVQAVLCALAVATAKIDAVAISLAIPSPRSWLLAVAFFAGALAILLIGWRVRSRDSRERLLGILPETAEERSLYFPLCVVAGVSEEVVYRGVLFCALGAITHNVAAAVAIASIVFGLAHATQGAASVAVIIGIGAALHLLVLLTHSLVPAIALHILYDAVAGVLVPRLRRE